MYVHVHILIIIILPLQESLKNRWILFVFRCAAAVAKYCIASGVDIHTGICTFKKRSTRELCGEAGRNIKAIWEA